MGYSSGEIQFTFNNFSGTLTGNLKNNTSSDGQLSSVQSSIHNMDFIDHVKQIIKE